VYRVPEDILQDKLITKWINASQKCGALFLYIPLMLRGARRAGWVKQKSKNEEW
jgi:hypothetical protein